MDGTDDTEVGADGAPELEEIDLATAIQQRDEAQEQVLRLQAEMENVRRRLRREAEEVRKFSHLPLVTDLLPVVDNLQRAVEAARSGSSESGLLEGVEMVSRQFQSILERHDCQEIAGEGAEFDPHVHEAVLQQPSDAHPAGHVCGVLQQGYSLHDRVVRPSQVVISTGPAEDSPADPSSPSEERV